MTNNKFSDFLAGMANEMKRKFQDNSTISFSEINSRGAALPRSAFKHRAWWANHGSKPWLKAGLRTEAVDMERQEVTFRLSHPLPSHSGVKDAGGQAPHNNLHEDAGGYRFRADAGRQDRAHPLIGVLRGKIRIAVDFDLTAPADPDWGRVYDE